MAADTFPARPPLIYFHLREAGSEDQAGDETLSARPERSLFQFESQGRDGGKIDETCQQSCDGENCSSSSSSSSW